MFFSTKAFLAVLSCALVAHAQSNDGTSTSSAPPSESSPAGLDACILTCVTTAAASAGCSSFSDLTCVCTSTAFQTAALSCLQQNCTPEDVAAATQLQQQECAALGSSSVPTSTPTSTPSGTSSSLPGVSASTPTTSTTKTSSTGTPAGTPTTSSSSSAAMALSAPFSFGSFVGTLVASAGALVGAALVL